MAAVRLWSRIRLLFLLPGVLGVNVVAGGHEKGSELLPPALLVLNICPLIAQFSEAVARSIQITVQTLQLWFTFHRHLRAKAPRLSQRSAASPPCSTSVHALTFRQLRHFSIFSPCIPDTSTQSIMPASSHLWRCTGSPHWRWKPSGHPVCLWMMCGDCPAMKPLKPTAKGEVTVTHCYKYRNTLCSHGCRWGERNTGKSLG